MLLYKLFLFDLPVVQVCNIILGLVLVMIESENHRIIHVSRDLWKHLVPPPAQKRSNWIGLLRHVSKWTLVTSKDGEPTTAPDTCPGVWPFFVKKTPLESDELLMFQLVAVGPHSIAVHLWDESGSIFSLPCDEVVANSSKVCPLPFFFQPGQTHLSFFLLTMCSNPDWIGGQWAHASMVVSFLPGKIPFAGCPLLEAHKTGWCQHFF